MKNQVTVLKQGRFAFVVVIFINLFLVTSIFSQTIRPESVVKAVYFDKSKELRNIAIVAPEKRDRSWKDGVIKNKEGFHEAFKQTSWWTGPDPVLQNYNSGERSNPIVGENHDGVSNLSGVAPPDTDGDVGPNHYFQMVNLAFAIWDKGGNLLYGPADNITLWDGFSGPWSGTNDGDPIVLYDEYADRWIASQFSLPNYPSGPYYELVAVSETGDPTGAWYRYAFEFSNMPDYPKFGIWSDGYYFTINQFSNGSSWAGAGVCVLDRDAMLIGDPDAEMIFFNMGTSYGSLLPGDCDGSTLPPAGSSNYFVELNTNSLRIFEADIDWNNTNNSSVTVSQNITTESYSYSNIVIDQPGTSTQLMSISDRLMYRLQYRNFGSYQVMLTNHTVNADGNGQAGVRWYELRNYGSGWSIHQQGTYAPDDGENRWMASIAMNGDGDIALGYSVSSATTYPSIRFAGQNAESSGTGILDINETSIFEGSASQSGINRWGDYSMMSVDPTDDQTFWFTTEYSNGGWSWRTRIASFSYAPIVDPPVADFSADDSHPMGGQTVNFMDESTNVPHTWSWSFSPSTITYVDGTNSGSKNPKVQFSNSGFYTVTLTATNDIGSDTEVKTNFIEVLDCSPVIVYPYLQTFDEWATSSPEMSCTPDGIVPLDDCWLNGSGDDIDWDVYTTNTPSGETGPTADHTGNGNYLYTESSSCFNSIGYVISPSFNLTSLTNPELRFWYHMYGAEMGSISVQVSTNGGASWSTNIWSLSGTQGNSWQEAIIPLESYGSQTNLKIRITGTTGSNWHSDMAIDDFSVSGSSGSGPTANAGPDATVCENSNSQLNGTSYNSSSIEWTTSGDGTFDDIYELDATYTPGNLDQSSGAATLTLTAYPIPPATGNATDQMVLSVQEQPTATAGPNDETCEGVAYTVSAASASNYSSLLWTENGTGSLSNANTLTPTYTPGNGETGQVTLTLTVQGMGNCSPDVSTMQLNILSGTTANAGSDGVTCASFSYTITDASASNYSSLLWTENGTGYLLNASTLSPTYVPGNGETGIVTLTLTASGQGACGDSESSMEIEIFPAPTANAGPDDMSCSNTQFTVTGATATNGSSLLWTENGTGTLSNATTLNPTYTPGNGEIGDVTLTLTVEGQGTCNEAISSLILEIVAGPSASAGDDAQTCQGIPYTVNDATAANYSGILWTENGSGYMTNATGLTPTYNPGSGETGNVTLTLTVEGIGNCTDAVDTKQLVIFHSPTANAGSDAMVCAGSTYTLNGASATNYSSVNWDEDGAGYLTNANTLNPTYHPGANETGIVNLTLTAAGQGNCSDANSSMQLDIIPGATADAGSDAITCQNEPYTILDATATNYSSILWTSNGSGTISNPTTLSPTYVPATDETGDVTLILTVQSEGGGMCGSAGSTMILEILPTPVAYAGEDDISCQNEAYTISGAAASTGGTILWSTNGNGTLENPGTLTPTYYPANNEFGFVTLTLTVTSAYSGFCGEAISNMSLEIIQGATAFAGSDVVICEASAYTVTDATASNNSTILWTTTGNGIISNPTSLSPTYNPATGETGIVTLTLTVTSGAGGSCGTAVSSLDIEIIPLPFADAGDDDISCQNEPYTVSDAAASSNSTILWTENGTGSLTGATTLTPTYTPGANEIGFVTLSLSVISGNGGFCGTANSLKVLEIIPGAFAEAGPDAEICEDNSYTISGASASENSSILWTSNGAGTLTNELTLSPTYTPAVNEIGEVVLTMSVESGGGMCGIATSSMTIYIIPSAYANAGDNLISCQGESVLISGASASQNSTILWTTNGYGLLIDETTITPTYLPEGNEIGEILFTLTVTSENNGMCGIESSSMTVDIVPGATAFAGMDGTTCENNTYTVTDATASENSSILWTTNGMGILTDETTIVPSYTPAADEVGEINLTLTVQSGGGNCGTATSSKYLLIYPEAFADAGYDDESCQGEIYYLTGASASDYSSVLWTTNGSGVLTDETTLTPSYTPDIEETGEIVFTLTVNSGVNGECGTASSSRILNIVPGATAYAGPNGGMCEGLSYTIYGASASSNSSILWTTNGLGIISGVTTLTPTYTPAIAETGDVLMTLSVSSNNGGDCEVATSSTTITIYGEPVVYAGEDVIMCESDLLQLDGYALNYSSIDWSTSGDGVFDDESALNPIYYPGNEDINTGMVNLVITANSLSCNSVSDDLNIQISAAAFTFAGTDAEICDDETYQLSGTVENSETFIWTSDGDGVFSNATSLNPVYTPGVNDISYGDVELSLTGFSVFPCIIEHFDQMVLTIETCTSSQFNDDPITEFKIMPNPAYEYVRFSVDNLQGEFAEVSLINMSGAVVHYDKYEIINGSANGKLWLINLNQGVYFIQIKSDRYHKIERLIKLK